MQDQPTLMVYREKINSKQSNRLPFPCRYIYISAGRKQPLSRHVRPAAFQKLDFFCYRSCQALVNQANIISKPVAVIRIVELECADGRVSANQNAAYEKQAASAPAIETTKDRTH